MDWSRPIAPPDAPSTEDADAVEHVRLSLAEDKMELYVSGMATLGYTETQAAQMLLNRRKG